MKVYGLTNFEKLSILELTEKGFKGKKVGSGVVEFSGEEKEIQKLGKEGQSWRKILAAFGQAVSMEKLDLSGVSWKNYFSSGEKFMVDVEGVKGQENRIGIGKKVSKFIFEQIPDLEFDYKQPSKVVLVYFDGSNYFVGLDLFGERDKRDYRVFVHSASMRGDMGYALIRWSGLVKGEKMIIGLVRDGVVLIEAALFDTMGKIYGFDENMRNVVSAKKNAKLAGVQERVEINKWDIDELDVKFKEGEVDRLLFLVTKKDETRINEIYYQAKYVLRKGGTLLLFGRESWEISIPEKFKLVFSEIVRKGDSSWKMWLLEKK